MLTKNINFKDFKLKKDIKHIKNINKDFKLLLKEDNIIIKSLGEFYKKNYTDKIVKKLKKNKNFRIIGMGGSILGAKSIYSFLKPKVKKNFCFVDNLKTEIKYIKKKYVNLIISKSGNTLETISNVNIITGKNDKNIFITENRKSYLSLLAKKLKAEIIYHNNFIGGRYSVLSEVGMLPAELMGLKEKQFKQLNNLIKNKYFINSLISNVSNKIFFLRKKNYNSVILNYDEKSDNLFKWYQQLSAESLGKKRNGILPIISSMPKDNHSLMQYYLDGPRNNFFTFFYVREKNSPKIIDNKILSSQSNLKKKNIDQILFAQKLATQKIFLKKKIPFRSFEILDRDESTLGELFCFFILETILIGRALKINPYDQPSVESIKQETNFFLA